MSASNKPHPHSDHAKPGNLVATFCEHNVSSNEVCADCEASSKSKNKVSRETDVDTQTKPLFCDHGFRKEENCDYCNVKVLKSVDKKDREDRYKRQQVNAPEWVDTKD